MRKSSADIVRTALEYYASSDLEGFMALLSEDVAYTLFLDPGDVPFAGTSVGKDAFRAQLAQMHDQFTYVLYRPFEVRVVGNVTHNQVEFIYRHKATGVRLDGRFRLVVTVVDALITKIEEYHDAERIKSFMQLVSGARS